MTSHQKTAKGNGLMKASAKNKKYSFVKGDTSHAFDEDGEIHVVYRIKAKRQIKLCDGRVIKKGTYGGYIESEDNLSILGGAWVEDDACVFDFGFVRGGALVSDSAQVYGDSLVYGRARVFDNARVFGQSSVGGNSRVQDKAIVMGRSNCTGKAIIGGWVILCYTRAWRTILEGMACFVDCVIQDGAEVDGTGDIECPSVFVRASLDAGTSIAHDGIEVIYCADNVSFHYISSLPNIRRSDGYMFQLAHSSREPGLRILAGCRNFSFEEAWEHWKERYQDTELQKETFAILGALEQIARVRGLHTPNPTPKEVIDLWQKHRLGGE